MLGQVQQEFADQGVTVIAVNIAPQVSTLEEFRDYLQEYGAGDLVWAQDSEDGQVVRTFNVQGLGSTIVIDKNGRIVYEDAGPTPYQVLRTAVLDALG